MDTFGSRLKKARRARGIRQSDLAETVGVSHYQVVHRWEKGERDPSLEMIVSLADTLGVSTDWLLCRPADPPAFSELNRPSWAVEILHSIHRVEAQLADLAGVSSERTSSISGSAAHVLSETLLQADSVATTDSAADHIVDCAIESHSNSLLDKQAPA